MNQERYPFFTNQNSLDFEFESDGPRGKIKKVVRYNPRHAEGITFFNLAFGNWDEEIREIDDKVVSNNQDRDKILATVAATIMEVTSHFPNIPIYATGSSPARTRLYQMGISANLEEIMTTLDVYGYDRGHWQPFKRNVNYDAFLARRKLNR